MYTMKQRVRYSEVNQTKQLTLTGLVNYFQDCSTFQSEDIGVGVEFLEEHRRGWILSSWQIVVERYPRLGEVIETATWPTGFNGLFGTRNFTMRDAKGSLIAYANSVWVFMDMQAGRPVKPKEEEIKAYVTEPELAMEYAPRKIALPEEWETLPEFPVLRSQIDTNYHVNNSRYIEMALEVLPEGWDAKQVRVEYKKSAVYGDTVVPQIYKDALRTVVKLCDTDGNLYAVTEFTGERES